MPVLVDLQAFRPASSFVSWDTDAARNPARFIPENVLAVMLKNRSLTDNFRFI
jgi:hypothetical protein